MQKKVLEHNGLWQYGIIIKRYLTVGVFNIHKNPDADSAHQAPPKTKITLLGGLPLFRCAYMKKKSVCKALFSKIYWTKDRFPLVHFMKRFFEPLQANIYYRIYKRITINTNNIYVTFLYILTHTFSYLLMISARSWAIIVSMSFFMSESNNEQKINK